MTYIKVLLITVFLSLPSLIIRAQDSLMNQNSTISGIIYDSESGNPLPFATINNGNFASVFSEVDGSFNIGIKSTNDILSVSLMGYIDKDVVISGKSKLNIYLNSSGYSSFQNRYVLDNHSEKLAYTNLAVSTTQNIETSNKLAAISAESLIKGSIAGLKITQRNGTPGAGSDIYIRGGASLNATNRPLVIVDGMIYDTEAYGTPLINGFNPNPFNNIDINDIENITVVKDALSTYGSKAANGVIFISTKRAKEQATKIEFHTYAGVVAPPETLPVMNAGDYRLYLNEAIISSKKTPEFFGLEPYFIDDNNYSDYYRFHNNTNWQKEVFDKGFCSNYNLGIRGGDDIILLAASVGYTKHQGNVKNTDFSRFSLRLNSDITISKKFSVIASFSFVNNQRNLLSGSSLFDNDDPLYMSQIKAPFNYPYIKDESGIITPNLEDYDLLNISNPVALISNMQQNSKNFRLFGSFDFNLALGKNLVISNLVGISFDKNYESVFVPKLGVVPVELPLGIGVNRAANRNLRHTAYNNDFRLKFNKSIRYHNIRIQSGVRLNYNKNEEDWVRDYNTANDQMRTVGNGVLLYAQNGGLIGNWANIAYYTVADYDFNKKYFLNLSASLDGSSRFGKEAQGMDLFNAKFGFFPSVSASWLVSSEPFLTSVSNIDLLKFRISYGITGNDDIGNYASKKSYGSDVFLGYPGILIGNLWNPKLKWETNKKTNLGMDVSVFKERISLSFDYYQNQTEDMLFFRPVDVVTGFSYYTENNGGFKTKGMDITINSRIINKPVKWDLGLVVSKYNTEVTSVYGNKLITSVLGANVLTEVGQPLGVFYGYKTKGVYATQQDADNLGLKALMPNTSTVEFSAGDVIFDDYLADKIINESDMQVIGDPTPDFTGEFNTRLNWKAITLEAALTFSYGNDVFNYLRYKLESMTNFNNQAQSILNRWRYEGQNTGVPKVTYGDPIGNSRFSDRWIEDGSYVRLQYVTLSYKLPSKISFLKNSELYVTGTNLFTFTNYKGLDPEFSYSGYSLARGIDPGQVPQSRAFFMGLKIGL